MRTVKTRAELEKYNDAELFNKRMYSLQDGQEYNYYWEYPNINFCFDNTGLHRYYILTEQKEHLTETHYFKKKYDVSIFKHNRYSFPYYHSHDFFELIFVWSGSIKHCVCDEEREMKKGQICIIPPNVRHSLYNFDDSIVVDILFKNNVQGTILRELLGDDNVISRLFESVLYDNKDGCNGYVLADTEEDPIFEELILEMFGEKSEDKLSNIVLEANLLLFLSRLIQKHGSSLEYLSTVRRNNSKSTVDDILLYMNKHLSDVTLDSVAEKFHFNKYYVSRLVKSQTELTFTQLIRKIRLFEARRLLISTSLSLRKIGEAVGFVDSSNLVKAFKHEYDITPNQYRKQYSEIEAKEEREQSL